MGMLRPILTPILLLVHMALAAQTYFYINSITVIPASPTTQDQVVLEVAGDLSSTGAYISDVGLSITGMDVQLSVDAFDPGGATVLVPHTVQIPLGMLAAGLYTVTISGMNILDLAPVPEHEFIVSDAGMGCSEVEIVSIQYDPFDETMIEVRVTNSGAEIFSYPGFILFDAQGDTVAMEVVDVFGIGTESTHQLIIYNDPMSPSFTGTLELWTNFYEELACSFSVTAQLCPPAPCATLIPYVMNMGGQQIEATFFYLLADMDGQVASGTIELTTDAQFGADTICVPPGQYTITIGTSEPITGGQPWTGVTSPGNFSGPQQALTSPVEPLGFSFFNSCVDSGQNVPDASVRNDHLFGYSAQGFTIERMDGQALGVFTIYDLRGALLYTGRSQASRTTLHTGLLPAGMYILSLNQLNAVPVTQRFIME